MGSPKVRAAMRFDVASALSIGSRETQEDALVTDFAEGAPFGFAVLADGMGGHAAGDVASKIVVTEVFSDLKLRSDDGAFAAEVPQALRAATSAANACIEAYVQSNPASRGMGATLVALVCRGDRLNWISVGDSPLYLWRDGQLSQLNEDHSLAPQIDYLVRSGRMDPETGRNHPDRNCLTSVLGGRAIERIDCPEDVAAPASGRCGGRRQRRAAVPRRTDHRRDPAWPARCVEP